MSTDFLPNVSTHTFIEIHICSDQSNMSVFKTVCAIAVYFPQTVPDSVNHYISASYREETFLFIFIFPNRQDVTVAITALLSNCTANLHIYILHICFKSLRLFFINK